MESTIRMLSTLGLMGAMRGLSAAYEAATLRYLASPEVVPVLRQSGLEA